MLSLVACGLSDQPHKTLVPATPAASANYWCTWYAQNYWIQRGEEIDNLSGITNPAAREELTYNHLYNLNDGWATTYLPRGRSNYYFLIDHGWQEKDENAFDYGRKFFNLAIDPKDFPEYNSAKPEEALKIFNEEIKSQGWRGLGIWMRGNVSPEDAERFVKWSKYAGIEYWKIDGGDTKDFNCFKARQKFYPELVLEYITGSNGPINPQWDTPGLKSYPSVYDTGGPKQEQMLSVLQNSTTFRTYDASPILVTTTTLRRVHDILKQTQNQPQYSAILNVQDDCAVAAALGCLVAAKRHPNYMERTYKGKDLHHQIVGKRMIQKRMNEVERLGNWHRIAPAFPAGEGSYLASDYDLVDYYPYTEHDTWMKDTYGKTVYQSAPAVMARNMPLPKVEITGDAPYVMASCYPKGPVCVATEGRVKPDDQWYHPRANVTIQVEDAGQSIGIFGHYKNLVIEFSKPLAGIKRVWAQDLLADAAVDITQQVTIADNKLIVPGELIDLVGIAAGDPGDISAPGMVLQLEL